MVRPRRIAPLTGPAPTHLHPCSQGKVREIQFFLKVESLISNHAVASHREQEVVARGEYFRAEHC